jgi:hypothetical protein
MTSILKMQALLSYHYIALDSLAVRLTVPPVGPVEDLHLQVNAHCRAHQTKECPDLFRAR